jgi:signal transduction histidine kinase
MLEELRGDVQATLAELRELAHGIYPPLLRDRGLAEALRTAANRAVLPTEVVSEGIERYPSETEAAVYFCCLEAMQNAGKHAGEGASITVTIGADADHLTFCVADTGGGFDAAVAVEGHGFVNMRDRLGAVGGTLTVDSDSTGTRIGGSIPLATAR